MKRPKTLTALFVQKVSQPGRYGDGRGSHGLSLNVKAMANGRTSKSWVQRIRINGRLTNIGLGPYPIVTLKEARQLCIANKRTAIAGLDPRTGGIPTFEDAAETVIALHQPNWRDGAKSAAQWRASLRDYAFPTIGRKLVSDITAQDILAVLTPNWNDKRETMRRVKQRIGAIMKWAVAEGHRDSDPVPAVTAALPKNGVHKVNHTALPWKAVSEAIEQANASGAHWATKAAFTFLAHTACRSGEVRGATWQEIDTEARIWTIPASRMKAGKEHRVPLSDAAMSILDEASEHRDTSDLVFPSVTGRQMSDATMSKLLRENGIKAVPHGFRSSFRDWCGETGKDRELAEQALAHQVKGVEGAYARSDLLDRRRDLMNAWSETVATTC